MIVISVNDEVNVWMMKNYGVKESWTMLYSFEGDMITTAFLRPLAYSRNYDKILLSLLWYDIKAKEFKDVNLPQLKNISPFHSEMLEKFC